MNKKQKKTTINFNRIKFLLTIALLVTALIPQSSATTNGELKDGYEFVWNTNMNITVYFPNTLLTFNNLGLSLSGSENGEPTFNELAILENHLENNAWRDLNVFVDPDRNNLIGVNMMLTWSTDSNAIAFADYRDSLESQNNRYNGIGLSTTDNESQPIVDVIPDFAEEEGDVSRSATDIAGTETQQYRNTTDIDTAGSVFIDLTNYNHSSADWLELSSFKMSGAANATITVGYNAATTGTGGETVTVLTTDQYFFTDDWFGQLPMPSSASYTHVDNITFSALQLDEFRLYRWPADYKDSRNSNFVFTSGTSTLGLNFGNPFSGITDTVVSAVTSFPVVKDATKIAQHGVGYADIKISALGAAAASLGVQYASIVDHNVNSVIDKITAPLNLAKDVYDTMQSAWDNGQRSAQILAFKAREQLKAVTLTVGIVADSFGSAAETAVDFTGDVIGATIDGLGTAATGTLAAGQGMFDEAKDTLGRLPAKGAGLFSKINPFNFLKNASSTVKYAIIAIVVLAAIILFVKFAM